MRKIIALPFAYMTLLALMVSGILAFIVYWITRDGDFLDKTIKKQIDKMFNVLQKFSEKYFHLT